MRKKKEPTLRTKLKNWSKAVRDRDGNKCVICGRTDMVQAHHIVQKKYDKELRFDLNNGISLCPKHHSFGKWSAHMGGFFFHIWLEQNRPNQYAYLKGVMLREWAKEQQAQDEPEPLDELDWPENQVDDDGSDDWCKNGW